MFETAIGSWILCHVPNAECANQDGLLDRFLLDTDAKYVATDSLAITKESSRVLVGSGNDSPTTGLRRVLLYIIDFVSVCCTPQTTRGVFQ
ncbi:hypothetical protein MRX96_054186 [Rhipicephalus microplus]